MLGIAAAFRDARAFPICLHPILAEAQQDILDLLLCLSLRSRALRYFYARTWRGIANRYSQIMKLFVIS